VARQWRGCPALCWAVALIAASVSAVAGCAAARPGPVAAPLARPQFVALQGELVYRDEVAAADLDPALTGIGAAEYIIRYRSTSGVDGAQTVVGAAAFVPAGRPPAGGWPVVTLGHGTTGLIGGCAPSHYRNLLGSLNVVVPLLRHGYVVVATDYQGLGTGGPHPYLEPRTAAYNLIDAVRAVRELVPAAGRRWAAIGASQGGQASWSAAEHADSYGSGLEFVGSANLSPAADLSEVVPARLVPLRLSLAQQMFLPLLIAGLRVQQPGLDEAAYLHGPLWTNRNLLIGCINDNLATKAGIATRVRDSDYQPVDAAAAARMRFWLRQLALPSGPAAGPMLVLVGGDDSLINPAWTREAARRACAFGDVVAFHETPHEGHARPADIDPAVAWIADRFAGAPAPDSCAELTR
jgi:alpha-beta hydrolase superfamily lysophospholipase